MEPMKIPEVKGLCEDRLKELALSLKEGECFPLTQVAEHLGVSLSRVHIVAKKIKAVTKVDGASYLVRPDGKTES